jgi:hypothetical protein
LCLGVGAAAWASAWFVLCSETLRSFDFTLSKKEDKKSKENSEMMWHRGAGGRMTTQRDAT